MFSSQSWSRNCLLDDIKYWLKCKEIKITTILNYEKKIIKLFRNQKTYSIIVKCINYNNDEYSKHKIKCNIKHRDGYIFASE